MNTATRSTPLVEKKVVPAFAHKKMLGSTEMLAIARLVAESKRAARR